MKLRETMPPDAPAGPVGFLGRVPQPHWFAFQSPLEKIERFEFYQQAKKAFAVVATG